MEDTIFDHVWLDSNFAESLPLRCVAHVNIVTTGPVDGRGYSTTGSPPPTNRYSYLYSFDPHLSYPFLTLFQVPCAMSSRMYYRTGHR